MKFEIALFGSFKDAPGYVWKLPSGYNRKVFESIKSLFSKQYDDGRRLGSGELYGGYCIDAVNDRFYAFRHIDGGEDSLGREGVIVTNWAVGQYSNLVGKDLGPLFDCLTMRQLPSGECIEVDLPGEFAFSGNGADSVLVKERVIQGEEAKKVLRLPAVRCRRKTLVEFALKDQAKEASVKFLSPEIKTMSHESKSASRPRLQISGGAVDCFARNWHKVALCGVCLLGVAIMLISRQGVPQNRPPVPGTVQQVVREFSIEDSKLVLRSDSGIVWEKQVCDSLSKEKKKDTGFIQTTKDHRGWFGSNKRSRVEIQGNEIRIDLKAPTSGGSDEPSGDYYLIDEASKIKRARLTVKDGNIDFKVLSDE